MLVTQWEDNRAFQETEECGETENPDGSGHVGNPVCGDIKKLYIRINDSTVVDAKFKVFGCGATSSIVTEMVKGKSIRRGIGR